ncbi:hypothetical protein OV450_0086 [Actinobacteria bacterium OV450]|nr:hypothetical protein OV450_0086 [Actinobacteria bacterium OV450]
MSILTWRNAITAVTSAVLISGIVVAPDASAASPGTVKNTTAKVLANASGQPTDLQKGCFFRDGTTTGGGMNTGGTPPRFAYGNSPYLGAQFDSCGDVVRIYYGGYNATHYNIRYVSPTSGRWVQQELGGGSRQVWTITAQAGDYNFVIQACNRGGALSRSSCTRWSPQIYLNARPW